MDGEDVADDQQPYNSNDEDNFYLGQMNVDDKALQIQANNQLAAKRMRASGISRRAERALANNDDDEDIDNSRTGEAAEAAMFLTTIQTPRLKLAGGGGLVVFYKRGLQICMRRTTTATPHNLREDLLVSS